MVLLLDDLDRADATSRTLADSLMAECATRRRGDFEGRGLAIIATAGAAFPLGPGREGDDAELIVLRPLRYAEARELLRALARPLAIPEGLERKAVRAAGGFPFRLRRFARGLKREWGRAGVIPTRADLPDLPAESGVNAAVVSGIDARVRAVLFTLAAIGRPTTTEELADALGITPRDCLLRLHALEKAELAARATQGARSFRLAHPGLEEEVLPSISAADARRIHARLADRLSAVPSPDLTTQERLARHLILSGRRTEGRRRALQAADSLRAAGFLDRALRVLEEAAAVSRPRQRLPLVEAASELVEESGDHRRGLHLLEPFLAEPLLSLRQSVHLRRRLGVHYHRSGRSEEAIRVLEEARGLAHPTRDLEDLVVIDSELAEIYNLRGRPEASAEACRRGLERLEALPEGEFRGRMEVAFRASRGHLELRRFNLASARRELLAAFRLSRRFRMPAVRAIILNNLGITENQLNLLRQAGRRFHAAERLLLAAGERRPVVSIACNLAVIAAKRGDRQEALAGVERALSLLRHFPGERLEFFAQYTRGLVAVLLGEAGEALDALPQAMALGERVGDRYLVRFSEVYLAEALLACGRYGEALRRLGETARAARRDGSAVIERMAQSRMLLAATLAGHRRAAAKAREALLAAPRDGPALLETWSDLAVGFARIVSAESAAGGAAEGFEAACAAFRAQGVVFGERFARLGRLLEALACADRGLLEVRLREMRRGEPPAHQFLAVAEPLAFAEAAFVLGDVEQARERLAEASGAIVGSPFLELDWRIEFLRARLAVASGDIPGARSHLHRSRHTRDLLLQLLPARMRQRFLAHPRFAGLHQLARRLEKSPRLFSSRRIATTGVFEGMVGRSTAMAGVFKAIELLRQQDGPVLIAGPTGTGKELAARALHRTSPRARGPFFAVHCASLPVELFESELFGYHEGAFSGAEEARPGLLESLKGGTLLLDEVGDLPLAAQAKLLRVLDSGTARRLGSDRERPVDVRFLASTAVDLRARVEEGKFRADLFYRLGAMEVRLPPLAERREDVPLLARHLLEKHSRRLDRPAPTLAKDALEALEGCSWPGNVRQLEGVLLRVLVSHPSIGAIRAADLAPRGAEDRPGAGLPPEPLPPDRRRPAADDEGPGGEAVPALRPAPRPGDRHPRPAPGAVRAPPRDQKQGARSSAVASSPSKG